MKQPTILEEFKDQVAIEEGYESYRNMQYDMRCHAVIKVHCDIEARDRSHQYELSIKDKDLNYFIDEVSKELTGNSYKEINSELLKNEDGQDFIPATYHQIVTLAWDRLVTWMQIESSSHWENYDKKIKELSATIDQQKKQIEELKKENKRLKNFMEKGYNIIITHKPE